MTHHTNNGRCPRCTEIMDRYPNLYRPLRAWFVFFQDQHPEGHISCAGRGQEDQEACFLNGTSHAHWLESAHNYNAAIDMFLQMSGRSIYDKEWFNKVLYPALPKNIVWYGLTSAVFHEFPHLQISDWQKLRDSGLLMPVEQPLRRMS